MQMLMENMDKRNAAASQQRQYGQQMGMTPEEIELMKKMNQNKSLMDYYR